MRARLVMVCVAGLVALSVAHAEFAYQGEQVVRQRVIEYVTERYGDGTPIAAAALTYASAVGALWEATAQTQRYDLAMTQRAAIAQICLRGQLEVAGTKDPGDALADLERTIASDPVMYAGELYAAALAQQHPLDLAMSPRRACELNHVPLP